MSWACCSTRTVMSLTSLHHESKRSFMPLIWSRNRRFMGYFMFKSGGSLRIWDQAPTCCRSKTLGCTQVIWTFWSTSSMFPLIRPTDSAFITSSSTCRRNANVSSPAGHRWLSCRKQANLVDGDLCAVSDFCEGELSVIRRTSERHLEKHKHPIWRNIPAKPFTCAHQNRNGNRCSRLAIEIFKMAAIENAYSLFTNELVNKEFKFLV